MHRAGGRKCGTAGQRENTHHWITVLSAQGQALWEGLRDLSRDHDSSQELPATGRHRGRDSSTPGTSRPSSNVLPVKPVLPPWKARPEQVSGTFHVLPSLLVNPLAVSQEEMQQVEGNPTPWRAAEGRGSNGNKTGRKPHTPSLSGTALSSPLASGLALAWQNTKDMTCSADSKETMLKQVLNWSLLLNKE